ncbi:uncharacterized protein LOC120348879 [Nilaparvata lugens]|uniref:Seminal fluid protein n=1 Tax=Nilaparvata lugens TaxID=108931 RepID=A0A1I9WL84_NILLU|nr:uncharacterized protein LOC111045069 [Nilaparvata lugens]XP_039290686.1 uncharacterized protein LOC120348879 [Nilaparvata lugens]APA33904.1 seminal fluid protein [Nilaparvata lugens]
MAFTKQWKGRGLIVCMVLISIFQMASPYKISRDVETCLPGELVWVKCNLCLCNLEGQPNAVCAKMWCQPTPKYHYDGDDVDTREIVN